MATVYTKSYLLKCAPHELEMWRKAAGGLPLAPWIREVLNEASGNVVKPDPARVLVVVRARSAWSSSFRGPDPRPSKRS
jgi:hypothetical protein